MQRFDDNSITVITPKVCEFIFCNMIYNFFKIIYVYSIENKKTCFICCARIRIILLPKPSTIVCLFAATVDMFVQ